MSFRRFCFALGLFVFLSCATTCRAEISKGNRILIERGLQVQGLVATYDNFQLSTFSNANYTAVHWLWDNPRSYSGSMSKLGAAPGFPWARWVSSETDMPAQGDEAGYLSQLVNLQLADEWNLNDDATRTRAVNWFNSVSNNWPNTILSANNWGGQVGDSQLIDFVNRARPDMICFDTYPWKSIYDSSAPDHIGAPIGGPPTTWYSHLRIYRDISRAFNIPFGSYVQTFHAVEEYFPYNIYRNPSPSELRLNMFGALAFNSKTFIDFLYNNGSSSLFTPPGGDSNPTPLYYEKANAALRVRNFGKALVRLKPIDEATSQWTTSIVFLRGRNESGTLNPIPINFYAGPGGADANTDWVAGRNDPYLRNWLVTNVGTKNNGQPGDVIIAWFKPLDESFDGTGYTNEVYMMVVNGLTATNGTAADCRQQVQLNFTNSFIAVEMLNPTSALVQVQTLPVTNGFRQLLLDLNGGDGALFKFSDGAPFMGAQVVGPPVVTRAPASRTNVIGTDATFSVTAAGTLPRSYQWRFNGADINGATTNSYTRTNVQPADVGGYTVVVTNAEGSVTSAPAATLTVISKSLLLYEPFDYPNIGSPASSNTPANWAYGGTGANDLNVASGSLSYPGLPASIGNSVTNGGAGLGVRRLFGTNVNSATLYFSALFRINDLGYGVWNGSASQVGALTATDSSSFRLAVLVKSNSPSGYVIGVQKGGTGVTPAFDTTEYHASDTVFLVGKYDFDASPNAVSLWINPSPSTFGSGSAPMNGFIFATTGTDGFAIDRFNIRQNTAASVPAAMQWDELRIGNSWAGVTSAAPPAATLTNFVRLSDGSFQFVYSSSSGQSGSIYASTNLMDWVAIGAATQVAPGSYQFTDVTASNYLYRFYQLRWP